jgi:hypothetical protein
MPLIVVIAGSGLGTCAAIAAMVLEAGLTLAVALWLACGVSGLCAAARRGAGR